MERYDEVEARQLLPVFMRADDFDTALSKVVDMFGADASAVSRGYSVWDFVRYMDSDGLDALAAEMSIEYYDRTASVEAKRDIILSARKVQAKLGTKWALQKVLDIYFTSATRVVEWFDYDEGEGQPNHFRVETEYTPKTAAESARFLKVLNAIKRKSAILDKIEAVIENNSTARAAVWLHDAATIHMTATR